MQTRQSTNRKYRSIFIKKLDKKILAKQIQQYSNYLTLFCPQDSHISKYCYYSHFSVGKWDPESWNNMPIGVTLAVVNTDFNLGCLTPKYVLRI